MQPMGNASGGQLNGVDRRSASGLEAVIHEVGRRSCRTDGDRVPGAGGRHAVLRGVTTITKRRTARLAATGIARGDHDRRRARRRSARRGEKARRPGRTARRDGTRAWRWRVLQWRYNRCSKAREGSARWRGGSQRCGRGATSSGQETARTVMAAMKARQRARRRSSERAGAAVRASGPAA